MERIGTIARVGTVRSSVDSWRRKSVTEEPGRFSNRERRRGGRSTAAHAAATARRTILPTAIGSCAGGGVDGWS
jgi:hypothetical protein